jgi:hypothetical protein
MNKVPIWIKLTSKRVKTDRRLARTGYNSGKERRNGEVQSHNLNIDSRLLIYKLPRRRFGTLDLKTIGSATTPTPEIISHGGHAILNDLTPHSCVVVMA